MLVSTTLASPHLWFSLLRRIVIAYGQVSQPLPDQRPVADSDLNLGAVRGTAADPNHSVDDLGRATTHSKWRCRGRI
ncbi:MAG TPA: hypothetical protein VH164_15740 [Ktedonobacteraceae bacterium]|nr:hypothetical protein [Ktedonobacteraceae bacterium]